MSTLHLVSFANFPPRPLTNILLDFPGFENCLNIWDHLSTQINKMSSCLYLVIEEKRKVCFQQQQNQEMRTLAT